MNNKKYLSLLVAILAIGTVIYLVNSDTETASSPSGNEKNSAAENAVVPPTAKQPTPAASSGAEAVSSPAMKDGVYIVSYTNSGFQPKALEIARGKSVRFVNNSTKAMRIGDANSIVLNQQKTVGKGGIYEYTFNDLGTYQYSNQNNTADKGTVVVK